MVAPALLFVAAVYLYPAGFTLLLSVAQFDLVSLSIRRFVGLANFATLSANPAFLAAVLRTVYFGLLVAGVTTILSFLIALLLDQKFVGRSFVRVVVVLPWAVPPVVSGVLWGQMFHADIGFLNAILLRLGLIDSYRIWLGDAWTALHVIAIAEIWKAIPFMVLFFLAALQSLPQQVFEAAAVDGAGPLRQLGYILIPLLLPVAVPLMIIQFVWTMKAFDTIFVLTRGGPAGGTTTLNYFVYQEAFQNFDLGRASAAALVLLLVTLLVVMALAVVRAVLARRWALS
jgi:ABC-type sugar transport system permease subunit